MVKQTGIIFLILMLTACVSSKALTQDDFAPILNKPYLADSIVIPPYEGTELLPLEKFDIKSSLLSNTAKLSLKKVDIQRRANREMVKNLDEIIIDQQRVLTNTRQILRYQEMITRQTEKMQLKTEHALQVEEQAHTTDNILNLVEKAILAIALVLVII